MNYLFALTILVVFLRPATAAIQCYHCEPDPAEGEKCAKPTNVTTCEAPYDSCIFMSISMEMPFGKLEINGMKCAVKAACASTQEEVCTAANNTGSVTKCAMNCCSEDLCNGPQRTTVVSPTSAVLSTTTSTQRAVAHVGAIFAATAVLSLQALWQANN